MAIGFVPKIEMVHFEAGLAYPSRFHISFSKFVTYWPCQFLHSWICWGSWSAESRLIFISATYAIHWNHKWVSLHAPHCYTLWPPSVLYWSPTSLHVSYHKHILVWKIRSVLHRSSSISPASPAPFWWQSSEAVFRRYPCSLHHAFSHLTSCCSVVPSHVAPLSILT